jgi:phosphohistidine phosphatase
VNRQPRLIVVMRHAKAEQLGPTDLERELSPRGGEDAAAMGRWLGEQQITPDHALVSAAVRTRQTWEIVAEAAGWSLEPTFDRGLYAAGPDTAFDLMRETPDEPRTLLVIGHNPTIAVVAQLLDDGSGDEAADQEMTAGFPPSALAVFEYDGKWSDLEPATARLTAFHSPR